MPIPPTLELVAATGLNSTRITIPHKTYSTEIIRGLRGLPFLPAAVERADAGAGADRGGGGGPGAGSGRGALPDDVVAGGVDEGEALDAPLVPVLARRDLGLHVKLKHIGI